MRCSWWVLSGSGWPRPEAGPVLLFGEADVVVPLAAGPEGGVVVGGGEGLAVGLGGEAGLVGGEEVGERGVDVLAGPGEVLVGGDAGADGVEGEPVAGVAGLGAVGPDASDGGGDFLDVVHVYQYT